jgi:hypothetical protein
MTDHLDEDIDPDEFYQFAHNRLVKGLCAKIECPDYRHHEGPSFGDDKCRTCFKEKQ